MDMYLLVEGSGQLITAAIHNGHGVRPEITDLFAVSDADRLREEDPFTGIFAEVSDTRIVVNTSRFEVDLNRPKESAVYKDPESAWGLEVWKALPSQEVIQRSLEKYNDFYSSARRIISSKIKEFGKVLVFDLHSYNHLRNGPSGPPSDP